MQWQPSAYSGSWCGLLQDDRTFDIVPGGFDLQNGRGLVPSNTYMPRRRRVSPAPNLAAQHSSAGLATELLSCEGPATSDGIAVLAEIKHQAW